MSLLLASGSPRRAKILDSLGVAFDIIKTDAPEVSWSAEPERTVLTNAIAKGRAARKAVEADGRPILSADTIVWLDGKIYGKPRDLDEARAFLRTLSSRTHFVFTGVALDDKAAVQTSAVTLRDLSEQEIRDYVNRVNPIDRAGAYDIDCSGDLLVASYTGSYENIMGLPVEPLAAWGLVAPTAVASAHAGAEKPAPVGFFDSGLGGLCVLEAFKKLCPNESTVYLADSANCPYGVRTAEDVLALSRAQVRLLQDVYGCKMVVVACNTATAAAIDALRAEQPDFPFIGIEPALKPAALQSKSGVVGVLATAGTFHGRLYNETKAKFAQGVEVLATVADEFIALVERHGFRKGAIDSPEARAIVKAKIQPLLAAGCDVLVLGCTHFPHLKPLIEEVAAGRAVVLDPSEAVARHAQQVLQARHRVSPLSAACHAVLLSQAFGVRG